MTAEVDRVNSLLDKLTLEALMLMEHHIQAKISLEKTMSDGENHLVKSRYIMGHRNVSALQLPTESGPEFDAIAKVQSVEDEKLFGQKAFDVEFQKKSSSDKDESVNYRDPIKWFGVLVPQDMHKAQAKYKQAIVDSIRSINLQTQLKETCIKIQQLKDYKQHLKNEE